MRRRNGTIAAMLCRIRKITRLWRFLMTLEDQVVELTAAVKAVSDKLDALPAGAAVDLSPVLTALADIRAQFNPTAAPTT